MTREAVSGDIFAISDVPLMIFACNVADEAGLSVYVLVGDAGTCMVCGDLIVRSGVATFAILFIKAMRSVTRYHVGLKEAKDVTDFLLKGGHSPSNLIALSETSL